MPRYRTKPIEVEAICNIGKWEPIIAWLDAIRGGPFNAQFTGIAPVRYFRDGVLAIDTLEGTMRVDVGDWIILGVKGEFYPCKPDIFEATYEVVPDA